MSSSCQHSTNEGNEEIDEYLDRYLPLYEAACRGDWEKASGFLKENPSAINEEIATMSMTALHVATFYGRIRFVKELVEMMRIDALEKKNTKGETALHQAVLSGQIGAAQIMIKKNPNLLQITNKNRDTPIVLAAILGNKELLMYLYQETKDEHILNDIRLLNALIDADIYDVALDLLNKYPELATTQDILDCSALDFLAKKPSAFRSGSDLGFWRSSIYRWVNVQQPSFTSTHGTNGDPEDPQNSRHNTKRDIPGILSWFYGLWNVTKHLVPHYKEVYKTKLMHNQAEELVKFICARVSELAFHERMELLKVPFFEAAKYGSVKFIKNLVQCDPRLMGADFRDNNSLLHIAITHRQEKVFNLVWENSHCAHMLSTLRVWEDGSNVLHLAAKVPPPQKLNAVSGAALQMQREFQWFKAVEKTVQPTYKKLKNIKGKTPRDLFSWEHKKLLKHAEEWMRNMANSCSVVAMLIATVAFAAPFTVPGGNTELGIPAFLQNKYFMVFVISDALGLISSLTSLLIFLSILTSRYAEEDFFNSLPKKLLFALVTLFLSIIATLIAFGSTYFIMFHTQLARIPILITSVACLPVIIFACQHIYLLYELFRSTYLCDILHGKT